MTQLFMYDRKRELPCPWRLDGFRSKLKALHNFRLAVGAGGDLVPRDSFVIDSSRVLRRAEWDSRESEHEVAHAE